MRNENISVRDSIRPEYISLESQVDEPISWCPPARSEEDTTLYLLVSKGGNEPQALKLVNGDVIEVSPRRLPFKSALARKKRRLPISSIIRGIGTTVMYSVAILALAGTLAVNTGNISARTVLTNSMSGTFEPGDVVVTANWIKPEIGDIALYRAKDFQGNYTTEFIHRVIEFDNETTYRFKGDYNLTPDPLPVDRGDVVGVLQFYIPKLGLLLQPNYMLAFVAAVFFLYLATGYVRDLMFERKHFRKNRSGRA